jgi:sporulation protein YabP
MVEPIKSKRHEVKMLNRKLLEITGVESVNSFHSEAFHLITVCGYLVVKGQHLHIQNLNLEQCFIVIEGTIDQMIYPQSDTQRKSKKILSKWFK